MPAIEPERLLSGDEIADRAGITRRYLEMMVKDGRGPPSFKLGRLRRFPETGYARWIADKLANAQSSTAA